MNDSDATARFTDRVSDYVRYRPGYPPELVSWLHHHLGTTADWEVVDIGAGTGISSQMLLAEGHRVTAVEPNAAMRAAAEQWLGEDPRFRIVDGRADATGLADASVDLITVAQAFHWFDPDAARREFRRILRPNGVVAIFWNTRLLSGTPFREGYEALLQRYGTDYAQVAERYGSDQDMRDWFGDGLRGLARLPHRQRLDFDGLRGRLLSSSYAPPPGHPNHEPMLARSARAVRCLRQQRHHRLRLSTPASLPGSWHEPLRHLATAAVRLRRRNRPPADPVHAGRGAPQPSGPVRRHRAGTAADHGVRHRLSQPGRASPPGWTRTPRTWTNWARWASASSRWAR